MRPLNPSERLRPISSLRRAPGILCARRDPSARDATAGNLPSCAGMSVPLPCPMYKSCNIFVKSEHARGTFDET